jgi:hypothetical protein
MAERSMWGPPFCSAFDPSDKAEASLDPRLRCTPARRLLPAVGYRSAESQTKQRDQS